MSWYTVAWLAWIAPISDSAVSPRLCGVLTGQTDLAASYTAAQVAASQSILYAATIR